MGEGKTTVIAPALALLLASPAQLVVMTMPSHLVGFSRGLLRERLAGVLARPAFVLHCERAAPLTAATLECLRATRERCGVVICARAARALPSSARRPRVSPGPTL